MKNRLLVAHLVLAVVLAGCGESASSPKTTSTPERQAPAAAAPGAGASTQAPPSSASKKAARERDVGSVRSSLPGASSSSFERAKVTCAEVPRDALRDLYGVGSSDPDAIAAAVSKQAFEGSKDALEGCLAGLHSS